MTNSILVELLVLNYYLVYVLMVDLFPSVWVSTLCPLQSGWNPWYPSIHYLKMLVLLTCSVISSYGVTRSYLKLKTIFFQFSSSGALISILRNATVLYMSALAILVVNSALAKNCDRSRFVSYQKWWCCCWRESSKINPDSNVRPSTASMHVFCFLKL